MQAALISELDKQTKDLEAAIYAMQQTQNNMDAALREMQEEAAEKKAPKKGASALQVLTFLAALLTLLFEVDALFLNDDRHLNNIAVLEKGGQFDYCPIFDNGAGLLSNVQMAPMDVDPAALIRTAKAQPFHTTFNRQVIHARNLYGPQLHVPKFTAEALRRELEEPLNYYAQRDHGFIADRVCRTILTRQRVK